MTALDQGQAGQPPANPNPQQPGDQGGQPPQNGSQGTAQQGQQGEDAQSLITGGSQTEDQTDAVYEREFQRLLAEETTGGGGQSSQVGQQSGQQAPQTQQQAGGQPPPDQQQGGQGQQGQGDGSGQDAATRMGLSQERQHLLQRNHLTPEAVEAMPASQREQFITNLEKREADTQAEINRLKQAAGETPESQAQQQQGGQQGQAGGEGEQSGEGQPGTDAQNGQDGQLAQQVRQEADKLVETFGDEAKGFADQTVQLAQTVEQAQQAQQQVSQQNQTLQSLLADMTLRSAADKLTKDYPSLEKPEARQQLIEKFRQEWPNSPHKKGEGSVIDRIQAAMKDTAAREFGNVTEAQAAASLHQRTEQQLQNQPDPGQGGNRPAPTTEDDVYDQAFQEHLKPALSA